MTIECFTTADSIEHFSSSSSMAVETAWSPPPAAPLQQSGHSHSTRRGKQARHRNLAARALLEKCTGRDLRALSRFKLHHKSDEVSGPRLRDDADIWFWSLPALRVLLLGFVIAHRAGNDHIFPLFPVHRGSHLVLGSEL